MSGSKLTMVGDADKKSARIHDLVKAPANTPGLRRESTRGMQRTLLQFTTLQKRLQMVHPQPLSQSY